MAGASGENNKDLEAANVFLEDSVKDDNVASGGVVVLAEAQEASQQTLHGASVDAAPQNAQLDTSDPRSPDFVKVKLTRIEFAWVFLGLALVILLAALDQTIVATAIPALLGEFRALDQISWVGTGYLLTTTAFAPLYGKLSDTFGRKPMLLFAIVVFEIGSAICGAAVSMTMLIVGRAIAGVGGGGIFSLVLIIISDIVSFRDRGKYQGMIGAVFGLASVVGPLLGGAFTDHISWRWCFYINLPVGFVTVIVVVAFLKFQNPDGSVWDKLKRIDFLGTLLVIAAITCMIVPLQYGGGVWAWSDWRTIVMFVASAVLIVSFALVETFFAKEPIVPPSMFENVSVYMFLLVAIFLGATFFGLVYYLPSYFQLVNGDTATQAGLETIPLIAGVVIMSITSGQLVSKFGFYTPFIFFGSVVATLGAVLCSTLTQDSSRAQQVLYLLVAGMGIGSIIQIRVIGIQASVSPHNIAVATSTSNLFQTLGGTLGVAIVGTVFNNVLMQKLGPELANLVIKNPTGVRHLDPQNAQRALQGFSDAFDLSYKSVIPMAGMIFVVGLFIKQVRHGQYDSKANQEPAAM